MSLARIPKKKNLRVRVCDYSVMALFIAHFSCCFIIFGIDYFQALAICFIDNAILLGNSANAHPANRQMSCVNFISLVYK